MKTLKEIIGILAVAALMTAACGGGDDESVQDAGGTDTNTATETDTDTDSDTDTSTGTDTDTDTDTDTETDIDTDTCVVGDQEIGSVCCCVGDGCVQPGVNIPIPNGGTIIGCDGVPTDVAGAELACLRSYVGDFATNTYFANGYCALIATKCEGDSVICDTAVMGSYDAMTACPQETVMLSMSQEVEVNLGTVLQATIDNKTCVASCADAGQCREDEVDPVLNEPTQYQCIDKDGVMFCYDPRNLPAEYQAQ